ncbi:MAG: DUF1801 domain-containing protein [Patescibacteria group bacterium]|jgi:hypothetical protein
MTNEITAYNNLQAKKEKSICDALRRVIDASLPKAESKVWHGGPVWFLAGNPIVGYSLRKQGVQLLFWSGMSFAETDLLPVGNVKKFKAAGVIYTDRKELKHALIKRWLRKAKTIQWDYKNIIKRRGKLVRLK